jgi:hypothetical protein
VNETVAPDPPVARTGTVDRRALVAVALTLVALLPVVVVVVTRAGREWMPVGDLALVDLRVRDVWSRAIPLVGTYNRFGWNHPGPAMFWALAPLSGLTGQPAWATLVGGALLQGAAVVAAALVSWRRGRLALVAAVLALLGLTYGALGTTLVLWPWNPSVALPWFVVFVLLVWCVADGDLVLLPFAVAVGTFLVQTHVGYAPLVVVGIGFAVVGAVATGRREPTTAAADAPGDDAEAGGARRRSWRAPLLWSAGVLVLAWIPPLVQELVRRPNVERLVDFLQDSPGYPRLGFRAAAGIVADQFRVPPPWLGGHTVLDSFSNTVVPASRWWLVIPIALVALAGVAVVRTPACRFRSLVVLVVVLLVVGWWSIARVSGGAERYVFYWRVPLAIALVFVAFGASWYAFGLDRSELARRSAFVGLSAVIGCSSIALGVRVADTGDVLSAESIARSALARLETPELPSGRVLVRAPDTGYLGIESAVVNELDRRGVDVVVDPSRGFRMGESRTATPGEADEVLYVVEGGQYLSILAGRPDAHVLWSTDALSPAKEAELRRLQQRLYDELVAAGRTDLVSALGSNLVAYALADVPSVDQQAAARVDELNAEAAQAAPCRCGIIAFPADAAPSIDLRH